ncbi:hypothetical protein C8J55DRAFT_558005 [Lentinula edodes]|uniref:Fungal-type protein kinase domain-containing protein n=1 Tax=Lentinula lateritia TaxID=40482 RepID=A0A9W9ARH8_9AGAR|nr:hypothetical protein C8J55DRAFT_558005 [Lentinula edodes]
MFIDIPSIEIAVLRSLNNDSKEDTDKPDVPLLKSWAKLLSICPALGSLLENASTVKGQMKYEDALEKISRSVAAREHHTGSIRDRILDWIDLKEDEENGFKSLKLVSKSRRDPRFSDKLENGETPMLSSNGPAFLYDEYEACDNDPESGLFLGSLLYRVFCAIFFGPSTVMDGKFKKNSIADRNGMRCITGRHIAYAAVQTRFALSTNDKWNHDKDYFIYSEFYQDIVDYFESDPEDEVVVNVLKS